MADEQPISMKETGMGKFEYHKQLVADRHLKGEGRLRVLLAMWDYSDKDGRRIRPGRERLMRHTNLKSSATDAALKFLVGNGYLVVQNEGGRGRGGRGLATVYELGVPGHWPKEIDADGQPRSENTPSWREVLRGETSCDDGTFGGETSRRDEETSRRDGQNPPPPRDPSDPFHTPSHHHEISAGAHPPEPASGELDWGADADGDSRAQSYCTNGLDWSSAQDEQGWDTSTPGAEGDRVTQVSAPTEPAPSTKQPAQDTPAADQAIGPGYQAFLEYRARAKTDTTTR